MEKVLEFFKKNAKLTITLAALGLVGSVAYGTKGCEVSVAPAEESVVAPGAGGSTAP